MTAGKDRHWPVAETGRQVLTRGCVGINRNTSRCGFESRTGHMAKQKTVAELQADLDLIAKEIRKMKEKRMRARNWITAHGGDWMEIEEGDDGH